MPTKFVNIKLSHVEISYYLHSYHGRSKVDNWVGLYSYNILFHMPHNMPNIFAFKKTSNVEHEYMITALQLITILLRSSCCSCHMATCVLFCSYGLFVFLIQHVSYSLFGGNRSKIFVFFRI